MKIDIKTFFGFRFQEGGILHFWARHLHIEKAEKMRQIFMDEKDALAHHQNALTIRNLSGAFLLVGIGLCISLVVFLVEYYNVVGRFQCCFYRIMSGTIKNKS